MAERGPDRSFAKAAYDYLFILSYILPATEFMWKIIRYSLVVNGSRKEKDSLEILSLKFHISINRVCKYSFKGLYIFLKFQLMET